MSNSYFQFKQFRVEQDQCAMKVCTDACIQGALAVKEVQKKKPFNALDIGTGTGLLSLMLAQSNIIQNLHAIEINEAAAGQAAQNFSAAPFKNRICLLRGDVRFYPFMQKFDFIICNPPFYEKALKSPSLSKRQAMHASHLNFEELAAQIATLLNPGGAACLMAPYIFMDTIIEKASSRSLYPYQICEIRQTPNHEPFRSVLFFKKEPTLFKREQLVIKEHNGFYSSEFQKLLRPYYLRL